MKTLFLLIALLVSLQIHAECISGDCSKGYGTYTWPSGEKYAGEWSYGNRHGKGVHTYADGTTKTGVWENNAYFGTEAEWKAEQTKRKLAEEKSC